MALALVASVSLGARATAVVQSGADAVLPLAPSDGSPIASPMRFAWPAVGRIMFGFCWHPYDERNDEINIAVEPGTEVHAVEAGRIAYAGDEIRGLRNLILMSHENGWASAYANADELLVKRGDGVERGQAIARFGHGDRLHFELRHNSVSVDPLLYLEDAAPEIAQMTSGQCRS
jgi:murein DD-endopeptidase MepM/ murein hydrolase activator NlpD